MLENGLYLLNLPLLLGLDHAQEIVDVAIVPELLGTAVLILKGHCILSHFVKFGLSDSNCLQTFEQLGDENLLSQIGLSG